MAVVLASAVMATIGLAGGAHAGYYPQYNAMIYSGTGQNLCLDADGSKGTYYEGQPVKLWPCSSTDIFQAWEIRDDFTIRPTSAEGLCLDAADPSGTLAVGATVQLWTCNGGANQEWGGAASNNTYWYNLGNTGNYRTQLYLDANASSPVQAGTPMEVWSYNGGSNQMWAWATR